MVRELSGRLFLIAFAASLALSAGGEVLLTDALASALLVGGTVGLMGIPWGFIGARLAEEHAAARVAEMFADSKDAAVPASEGAPA